MCYADLTQDPVEDEEQLAQVKDWINTHHLDTVELNEILSNFPDISVVRISTVLFAFWKVYTDHTAFK